MFTKTRASALLLQLDQLIEKYEQTEPAISRDLRAFKKELEEHMQRKNSVEAVRTALRLSTWVKFIMDHWPDG